jgi:LPS-assembly protein
LYKIVLLTLFIFCSISSLSFGKEAVNLEADQIFTPDNNTIIATGNVLLTYKNMILNSDNITYYKNENTIEAYGNVVYQDEENYITADYVMINLDTQNGYIKNGSGFYSPFYHFSAEGMEKRGENSFILKNARLTTCEGERPDWHFFARDAKIDYGEYFSTKGATFNIKNTPVFYTPYFIWPIKNKRESGFLIPDIGYKTDFGMFFTPKYFIDLGIDKDATVGTNIFTNKGVMLNSEFRYAKSFKEDIYLYGEIIEDQDSKSDKDTRWRAVNKSNIFLRENLELKFNTDYVSDFKYKDDFDDFAIKNSKIDTDSDENRSVNETRLSYRLKYADISVRYIDNMQYHRLKDGFRKDRIVREPQVIAEKVNINIYNLFKVDYYFDYNRVKHTNSFHFFDTDNDKDKTTYDRYFVSGKIYRPFDLKVATFTPFFTQTYTVWDNFDGVSNDRFDHHRNALLQLDNDKNSADRALYSFGATLSFNEIYKNYKSFKHTIYNTFEYKKTPHLNQENMPDYIENDVIEEEDTFSYTLTNYFKAKKWKLKFEATQRYNKSKEDEFEPIETKLDYNYDNIFSTYFENHYDFYDTYFNYLRNINSLKFKNITLSTEYIFDDDVKDNYDIFDENYNNSLRYSVSIDLKKINFEIYQKFASNESKASFDDLSKQELGVKFLYKSDCWSIGLMLKEDYYDDIEKGGISDKTERTIYILVEFRGLGKTQRSIFEQ